jgi:acetyl esterase/lipase
MINRLTTASFVALTLISCSDGKTTKHDFKEGCVAEVYKEASGDKLWIYRFDPPTKTPPAKPAVVFFFGGAWNGGTVTQFEQHARYLASRGIVSFVADYRVKTRQNTQPDACVADGKSAIRWVRQNAGRLGIDPSRIAAGGGSAGGHVAAATGICDGLDAPAEKDSPISSKSNALLLFNPVYDNGPQGYGHSRAKKWFPAISPAHNISKGDPPTIVFLGASDALIPVSTAEKFDADLKALGIQSELWIYDGQPHGFFNEQKNQKAFLDTVRKMDSFLQSIDWLKGPVDEKTLASLLKIKPTQ